MAFIHFTSYERKHDLALSQFPFLGLWVFFLIFNFFIIYRAAFVIVHFFSTFGALNSRY